MAPQALSTLQQPYRRLSRQSSEVDYEIAEQLIQHAQGRRDGSGIDMVGTLPDFATGPTGLNEGHRAGAGDGVPQHTRDSRRSLSQEPLPEAHYAPIGIPVALGQVCR